MFGGDEGPILRSKSSLELGPIFTLTIGQRPHLEIVEESDFRDVREELPAGRLRSEKLVLHVVSRTILEPNDHFISSELCRDVVPLAFLDVELWILKCMSMSDVNVNAVSGPPVVFRVIVTKTKSMSCAQR
jgi:hypothetical protein